MIKVHLKNIGVNVAQTDFNNALETIKNLIDSKKQGYVCFLEANLLSLVIKNKELQDVLKQADIIFPDGVVLSLLNRINGGAKIQRIPGPSFMLKACEYGQQYGWKHFFYGGGEGVPERLAKNLQTNYPEMNVVGTFSPPFRDLTDNEEMKIKQMIEDSGADLLWVGLGGPKQELWMAEHVKKIGVPVMLGVGAAFDFHSGNRPWCPKFIRKAGMEWFFRTVTGGPKTFKRNVVCISKIAVILFRELF